jgi:hypothetical protein
MPKGAQPPGRLATSMVLNWSDLKLVGGGIQNLVSHRPHHAASLLNPPFLDCPESDPTSSQSHRVFRDSTQKGADCGGRY